MKVSYLALGATALIALGACGTRNANQNAAENIRDAAQNQADALQNQASNIVGAAENRADMLENRASNIVDAAENRADRMEAAPSGGGAGGADTNGM